MSEKQPKAPKEPKKTKEAPEAPKTGGNTNLGQMAKERAARRKSIAQKDVFKFVAKSEKPLAPQAECIVNAIEAAGPEGVVRPQLIENLKGLLTTKQPPERILTYYQKHLVDLGTIRVVNPERGE